MRRLMPGLAVALILGACTDSSPPPAKPAAPATLSGADRAAGKSFAERECKGCHGIDGKGVAPAIPHLAGQRDLYLAEAIREYRQGKRTHAVLREIAGRITDADARNVSAYYASLPSVTTALPSAASARSPYEEGKTLAVACAKCHSEDGNSTTPGIPSLSGQQPRYLVVAIQEYLNKERKAAPMHGLLPGLTRVDMENLALYFASQAPRPRTAPAVGDAAAGEPLSGVCGGCHGSRGVSVDSATPTLAGQDPTYLVEAIKAYRTTRTRESMRAYVANLSEKDIENLAAFYSVQKSSAAEKGQTLVQEMTGKCDRCHAPGANTGTMIVPNLRGQDRDYLVMALRAYRDDRRESSTMHRMSLPYGDSIIQSIASYYAAQPPK